MKYKMDLNRDAETELVWKKNQQNSNTESLWLYGTVGTFILPYVF